jgi:hypothetical protein
MQRILKFLRTPLALTMAAMLASAAIAPSGALAASHQHRHRAHRAYGTSPTNAYGAIIGGSGFSSPAYPGYGYGYGDNSHGCSACGP